MPDNFAFKLYKSNKLENFLPEVYPIIESLAKDAPLKKKSIVVQSDGMARWLTINVTRKDGVFANFDFVSPDGFLRNFAEKYFGITADSAYNKKNAEWELYLLLRNEKNSSAASYIGGSDARAFRLARTLADLFEQYFVYRPSMMASWQEGKPLTKDSDELWQFEIFRKLSEKTATKGFAQLFNEKCENAPENNDYPKGLILFGISIMNKYQLNMFRNLSRLFPVYLFAMTPSMEFYQKSRRTGAFLDPEENNGEFDTFFGRFCAASLDFLSFTLDNPAEEEDRFKEPDGKSLLSSIQLDILKDAETPEQTQNDDSVRIVSCRDKMREIEVAKDILLELFNKDKTLKPEDVAVMAPKINDYFPYITAVFGGTDPQDKTFIPWVVSDRSFASESRIASTFLEILRLMGSDFAKSKVFSVFRSPFVLAKFDIDEKTAGEIEKIVSESGVRHGLDSASNGGNAQNTWDFGLSRIMMSSVMPFSENGECFEDILPMKYLSKEDFDNLSSFIKFAKELFRCSAELPLLKTPGEFRDKLEQMLDFFFAFDKNDRKACEEMRRIRSVIDDFAEIAEKTTVPEVSFDALMQYLEDELGREQSGRGFLSANVNFCSLKPLRALPFRVIYLVGMRDGEFPRSENSYAFDLTRKDRLKEKYAPQPRSVRDNDKYLFAEAVVSAREKLIISYEAKDFSEDSKKHRSAALPVQILEKYIEKKTGVKPEEQETKYPVQPFSDEYFKEGKFKTYSQKDFEIAKAMFHVEQNKQNPDATLDSEQKTPNCGDAMEEVVDLEDLIAFFKNPIKMYFKKKLGAAIPGDSEESGDDEELFDYSDDLLAYKIRSAYMDMARNLSEEFKKNPDEFSGSFARRMKGEGAVPTGLFGEAVLKELVYEHIKDSKGENCGYNLCELAENIAGKSLDSQYISLDFEPLGMPVKIVGMIRNIENCGRMMIVRPVKYKVKYQIEVLIRHLAANAGGIAVDTYFFCREKCRVLEHVTPEDAKLHLLWFLRLWQSAKSRMPLFDPDLVDELRRLANRSGENDTADDKVCEKISSFFGEKWKKRNDERYPSNPEYILASELFFRYEKEFLKEFPLTEVSEIGRLLELFKIKKQKK